MLKIVGKETAKNTQVFVDDIEITKYVQKLNLGVAPNEDEFVWKAHLMMLAPEIDISIPLENVYVTKVVLEYEEERE